MKMKTVCLPTNETVNSLLSDKWNRKQFVARQMKPKAVYCQTNETEAVYCQTNETENSLLSDKWKGKQFVVR